MAGESLVGIAQLRSLLLQPDIAAMPAHADAVLDVISLLQRGAPAVDVVRHVCLLRELVESICYLPVYRLRRWLETVVIVELPDGETVPLSLDFRNFSRVVQHYRRVAWEHDPEHRTFDGISVIFRWRVPGSPA